MKKLLAMLLALVMILSLAACGASEEPAETKAPEAEVAGTEAAAAPAETELEPVTIKMWFHGSTVTPEASEKVMAELNAYLQEKINVTLEPIWGTWGDFDTATVTALTGGDDVDIYFTCNWSANEYNKYARDGYWVKLDDMLAEYAPELLETIPEGIWACAETNGYDGMGIYAVPGLKDTATQNCWDVNGTLLAELGYNVDEVCAAGLDYFSAEFEAMLQAAKDAKGKDFYPLLIEPAVLERMATTTAMIPLTPPRISAVSSSTSTALPNSRLSQRRPMSMLRRASSPPAASPLPPPMITVPPASLPASTCSAPSPTPSVVSWITLWPVVLTSAWFPPQLLTWTAPPARAL